MCQPESQSPADWGCLNLADLLEYSSTNCNKLPRTDQNVDVGCNDMEIIANVIALASLVVQAFVLIGQSLH